MDSAEVPVRRTGNELWSELSGFDLFKHFSDEQREAFLRAFDSETAMRIAQFGRGALVCRKGEYELDLCFVLKGAVDLFEVNGAVRTKVAERRAGEFYGEMGALGGLPRTLDIVAGQEGTEIFYLPRHCLKFVETNDEARAVLSDRFRERAIRVMVTELELFAGVQGEFIDRLLANCEIKRYDQRGIVLVKQGEPGDSLYIVRDGYVQVVREAEDGTQRVLAYRRAGEYFGEMSLVDGGSGVHNASVLTAGKCEVIKIRHEDVTALLQQFPSAQAQVRATIDRRLEAEEHLTPELSAILKESGQFGVIQNDALLVMDLDLCVKCDNCVTACESLHGTSRLIRTGIQIGKYLIPAACRHCDDPKCMNSCPTGAIKRRPEGEIYFQYDMCIGCGNCAIACPYDNIAMIETSKFDAAQDRKAETIGREFFRPYPVPSHAVEHSLWSRIFAGHDRGDQERIEPSLWQRILGRNKELRQSETTTEPATKGAAHIPAAYPIKCDLCDGLPFMGCVHACPTGSAMRIRPSDLFSEAMGAVIPGPDRVRKVIGSND